MACRIRNGRFGSRFVRSGARRKSSNFSPAPNSGPASSPTTSRRNKPLPICAACACNAAAAMTKVRGFREVFGTEPAVTACAPGRVNLLGDHTDYNDGFVLPTVIPQHTVVEAALGQGMHEVYSAPLDRHVRFGARLCENAGSRCWDARIESKPQALRIFDARGACSLNQSC